MLLFPKKGEIGRTESSRTLGLIQCLLLSSTVPWAPRMLRILRCPTWVHISCGYIWIESAKLPHKIVMFVPDHVNIALWSLPAGHYHAGKLPFTVYLSILGFVLVELSLNWSSELLVHWKKSHLNGCESLSLLSDVGEIWGLNMSEKWNGIKPLE